MMTGLEAEVLLGTGEEKAEQYINTLAAKANLMIISNGDEWIDELSAANQNVLGGTGDGARQKQELLALYQIDDFNILRIHQERVKIQDREMDEQTWIEHKDRLMYGFTPEVLFTGYKLANLTTHKRRHLAEHYLVNNSPRYFTKRQQQKLKKMEIHQQFNKRRPSITAGRSGGPVVGGAPGFHR